MQDPPYGGFMFQAFGDICQMLLSVGPNSDQVSGLEELYDRFEMAQTDLIDWFHLLRGYLVGGKVCPGIPHPYQRAVVRYKVVLKEFIRVRESLREKSPEAASAYLGALTGKSSYRALGMLRFWPPDVA